MDNRTYYYARVSSETQKLDTQIDLFKKMGACDRDIISDKASGKDMNRPGYQALKNTILRPGDTLVISRLDRLGRSKDLIAKELSYFKANNIRVKILDLPTTLIDFPSGSEWVGEMVNNILIEVLGVIAQRERENLRERQKNGIESARQRNVKFGRPVVQRPTNWDEVYWKWRRREIPSEEALKLTGLKKTSFYKLAEEQLLEDVINDVNSGKKVTVGHIQRDYWVSYPQARQVYEKLVEQGLIKEGH